VTASARPETSCRRAGPNKSIIEDRPLFPHASARRRVDQNRDYYFHKTIADTIKRCRARRKK
jgi:hypothetical protein